MAAALTVIVLLLPVPWLHVVTANPLGTSWRLDGRLIVAGEVVDPPGQWNWLAVGRPPLVIEVLRNRLVGTAYPPADLRTGPSAHQPALSDPMAAAVGLRHAGHDIPQRIAVQAREPLIAGLPPVTRIVQVNGNPLEDRATWEEMSGRWSADLVHDPQEPMRFTTSQGEQYLYSGPGLPYRVVTTIDLAPEGIEARIRFAIIDALGLDRLRNLSLGSSHGSMVALTTYAQASGRDLAQGRHIAGTGGILADGTITRIGGLPAKARAANRAGADVLIVPASQADEIAHLELRGTTVVPVSTLQEAIDWLAIEVA